MSECITCGDGPKTKAKNFPGPVIEINNPEKLILFRKVVLPVSMGTEEDVPASVGKYFNVLLVYEANGHIYLYSSDGVPTLLSTDIGDLDEIERRLSGVEQSLITEISNREAADAALSSLVDSLSSSLSVETATREAADAALGGRIDGVAGDVTTETTNRINADNALQANITAEATSRANADSTINGRIDAMVTDLAAETTARQTADANLQDQIDDIEEVIPAQATAQNQLADKDFVNSSVATNTANYISDNGQPFSSLAALEAYSGTLTNNDYAFVVGTDASSNTTYTRYKYNADTQTWAEEYVLNNSSFTAVQWAAINSGITSGAVDKLTTLANIKTIGTNLSLASDGTLSATDTTYTAGNGLSLTGTQFSADTAVLATQTDLTTGLATKQNTLTAGSNISISGTTISATDTTYSDFVGTDGTVAGANGLVPAPATTDAGKYLKADGTWGAVSAGADVFTTNEWNALWA